MRWLAVTAALLLAGAASAQGLDEMRLEGGPGAVTLSAGVRKLADLAYGPSAKQRLDVYLPPAGSAPAGGAPILVMVHGGAWMFGDKGASGVVAAKIEHWSQHGWVFVSVNNRLLPEADPLTQARDVASALAFVQRSAPAWGGDARRLVLMGHSAGAHLVALLSAAPALAEQAGAQRWLGTVVLDSAALDLAGLMAEPHPRMYDRVFGADPAYWRSASPTGRLGAVSLPMLLVCSTVRADDSCGQSERFAARVGAAGGRAPVLREALPHNRVNTELGRPGAYTDAVDGFIASLLPRAAR